MTHARLQKLLQEFRYKLSQIQKEYFARLTHELEKQTQVDITEVKRRIKRIDDTY